MLYKNFFNICIEVLSNECRIKCSTTRAMIEKNLELVKQVINRQVYPEYDQIFEQIAIVAHELHMSLEPHPIHHQYIIENNGMQPEEVDFYRQSL